jgi:hypothetical protein
MLCPRWELSRYIVQLVSLLIRTEKKAIGISHLLSPFDIFGYACHFGLGLFTPISD